jgi:hypothetical protein
MATTFEMNAAAGNSRITVEVLPLCRPLFPAVTFTASVAREKENFLHIYSIDLPSIPRPSNFCASGAISKHDDPGRKRTYECANTSAVWQVWD